MYLEVWYEAKERLKGVPHKLNDGGGPQWRFPNRHKY